jgi:hypothetical protein
MSEARVDGATLHVRPAFRKWLRHQAIDREKPVWQVLEELVLQGRPDGSQPWLALEPSLALKKRAHR